MATTPPIQVGVRLPLPDHKLPPDQLVEMCRAAMEMGYSSFWVGDHVVLPDHSDSAYPHMADGKPGFSPDSPWADPLLQLTWLAGQLPNAHFGTSIVIMTLRNPTLLAKQLATMSWLINQPFSFGVGTGWLRDEYDAIGAPFEKRATRAKRDIAEIRQLLDLGSHEYTVRGKNDAPEVKTFRMLPTAPAPVHFLWGGFSPLAMRLIASSADGWLPAKQSFEALEGHLVQLRTACTEVERDFADLKLVVKPGSGPDPESGAINKSNLDRYAELGFQEAILEMPYSPDGLADAVATLERVATRSWL